MLDERLQPVRGCSLVRACMLAASSMLYRRLSLPSIRLIRTSPNRKLGRLKCARGCRSQVGALRIWMGWALKMPASSRSGLKGRPAGWSGLTHRPLVVDTRPRF